MNKFTLMLDTFGIAYEVSLLLNAHNKLRTTYTGSTILNNNVEYLIERTINSKKELVSGCVGKVRKDKHSTIIKHLCVHEYFRRCGLANKMLQNTISTIDTEFVYMDIRSDNYPSLCLAEKVGFITITAKKVEDYYILTVGREVNVQQKR